MSLAGIEVEPRRPANQRFADVTVIVVNYNTAHLLEPMRDALAQAAGTLRLSWVIVDNASRDHSAAEIARLFPGEVVIHNQCNGGFGRANNQALPHVQGEWLLLLNTDAFAGADALTRSIQYMRDHPRTGVLGVRLAGRDGAPQPSCRSFPTPWNLFVHRGGLRRWFPRVRTVDDPGWIAGNTQACDWVPGCFYLVRRTVIEQVGLFDPRFFLYCEEVDHCQRVKAAGWEVIYFADASCVHWGGESAESEGALTSGRQLPALQVESELLYFRKHHGLPGVVCWVLLSFVLGLLVLSKALIRGPDTRGRIAVALRNLALFVRLTVRTRAGSVPTR